jgi:hypothetical protein
MTKTATIQGSAVSGSLTRSPQTTPLELHPAAARTRLIPANVLEQADELVGSLLGDGLSIEYELAAAFMRWIQGNDDVVETCLIVCRRLWHLGASMRVRY